MVTRIFLTMVIAFLLLLTLSAKTLFSSNYMTLPQLICCIITALMIFTAASKKIAFTSTLKLLTKCVAVGYSILFLTSTLIIMIFGGFYSSGAVLVHKDGSYDLTTEERLYFQRPADTVKIVGQLDLRGEFEIHNANYSMIMEYIVPVKTAASLTRDGDSLALIMKRGFQQALRDTPKNFYATKAAKSVAHAMAEYCFGLQETPCPVQLWFYTTLDKRIEKEQENAE